MHSVGTCYSLSSPHPTNLQDAGTAPHPVHEQFLERPALLPCPAQHKLPDTYPGYALWFAAKRENILKHKRAEVTGSTDVESSLDAKSFLPPHFLWSPSKLQQDRDTRFPTLKPGVY